MRKVWIAAILHLPGILLAQSIKPEKLGRLDRRINESSGLVICQQGNFWTINDGGSNELFFMSIDKKPGGHKKNIKIHSEYLRVNIASTDCEDLTSDSAGNIYLGDFGNNNNRRSDLAIYKVIIPDSFSCQDGNSRQLTTALATQKITYVYPDQRSFPPEPSNWNFDCEAFFNWNDSLYLFSKNISNPDNGYTKLYRLPAKPGSYIAELIDSFQTREPVTAACISEDGKMMVLLTYFSIWVFKDYHEKEFFKGKVFQFPMKGFTQKEAIAVGGDSDIYLTDEKKFGGGNLYYINLQKLDFENAVGRRKPAFLKRSVYNLLNNPKAKYRKIQRRKQ